jgi:hypothetical protein
VVASELEQVAADAIRTAFHPTTPGFSGLIDRFLADRQRLIKGPYVSIALPFHRGRRSDWFPELQLPFPPWRHQELAFQRLSPGSPQNTQVATGTGSGKTEAFLYPCLEHCRLAQQAGQRGVKVILIYPMNALATGLVHRIIAREHTGLLTRKDRERLENQFIHDGPRSHPNLLSATSTLEMGINIGDLSTVLLCSVPPEPANYLQRIGRAGRRDGNALVAAIVNGTPHDLYFIWRARRDAPGPGHAPRLLSRCRRHPQSPTGGVQPGSLGAQWHFRRCLAAPPPGRSRCGGPQRLGGETSALSLHLVGVDPQSPALPVGGLPGAV